MNTTPKNFRKRNAIYECLMASKAHPSAETIYTQLKPGIPDLSLGTVYRNLHLFKDQGLAISVATVNGVERFDGNTDPHVHFICTNCSAVIDLEQMSVPQALTESAEALMGGAIRECNLSFTGTCRDCLKKTN
ncbi:MAG: transcriptional repressor [Oscillospiraceae bacterium]|nr:transcriptional repressor [Oscillospiraceae bacterium]